MTDIEKSFYDSIERLGSQLDRVEWESPTHYAAWLRQTVGLVRHTTRFICLAAAKTDIDDRAAHYMWIEHLRGELNHDLVAIRDLKAMGYEPDRIPLFTSTQKMIDAQYDWINSGHPVALNGYALLLEGLACLIAPRVLERLQKVRNKNQVTFLSLHAKVDQDHYPDGLAFLNTLSKAQLEPVQKNLLQAEALYAAILKEAALWGAEHSKQPSTAA